MKNSILIKYFSLLLIASIFVFSSCMKENEGEGNIYKEVFEFATSSVNLGFESGATTTISGKVDGSWSVTKDTDGDWFSLSSESGSGEILVVVTANSANDMAAGRMSKVVFEADGDFFPVTIKQNGANVELDFDVVKTDGKFLVEKESGEVIIPIKSNMEWDITLPEGISWLTLKEGSVLEGIGDSDDFVLVFEENASIEPREAVITILGDIEETASEIVICQKSYDAPAISAELCSVQKAGGDVSIPVIANTSWTAVKEFETDLWYTINSDSGEGNGNLDLTVEENPSVVRSARILLTATIFGIESTTWAVINQDGLVVNLTLSTKTLDIASLEGSTANVDVTSNARWVASSDADWLTVSPETNDASDTPVSMTITAKCNYQFAVSRSATITIKVTDDIFETITVTQGGYVADFNVLNKSNFVNIAHKGGAIELGVQSNVDWNIASNQDWIIPGTTSGSYSEAVQNIEVTIVSNSVEEVRSGKLTLTPSAESGLSPIEVPVSQAAYTDLVYYQVGDLYPKDSPNPTGVVIEVSNGGLNGKVISLHEISDKEWILGSLLFPTGLSNNNGYANSISIMNTGPDWVSNYPIFKYVFDLNGVEESAYTADAKGLWYLPSEQEMKAVFPLMYSTLNKIIEPLVDPDKQIKIVNVAVPADGKNNKYLYMTSTIVRSNAFRAVYGYSPDGIEVKSGAGTRAPGQKLPARFMLKF